MKYETPNVSKNELRQDTLQFDNAELEKMKSPPLYRNRVSVVDEQHIVRKAVKQTALSSMGMMKGKSERKI